ncbi:hypothetical protein ACIBH1_41180 [Nonomuraea sp. NPDC050663]|uniref:hypothetical protein n=1 Tax=Nonomuraea sp. NPDC050663 TaxID=3364370 RepID=UPI0037984048
MRTKIIATLVVAVAAAGAGAFWLAGRDSAVRPAWFRGEASSALYSPIDTRQADGSPLTVAELFPVATVGGLARGATTEFADCAEVLDGVEAAGCTQALRAVYAGGPVAGQFVVFNLADSAAADALVAALGKQGFVRQAIAFEAARSRAQARALGHYVTVSWVGPVSGAADVSEAHVALDGVSKALLPRVVAAG